MYKSSTSFLLLFGLLVALQSCGRVENKKENNFAAPTSKKEGLLILKSRACYFDDVDSIEKKLEIKIELPSKREQEQVKAIMQYAGLPQNFKIYRGNIDNALATVVNNQRLIIYNKDMFTTIDAIDNSYWSSLFIIAHEIGHHLAYNISDTSNSLQAELEADIFAGSILCRMGADSNQVTAAIASSFISNNRDTRTHPAKYKRIASVKQSWEEAAELRFNAAIPPPVKGGEDEFSYYNLIYAPFSETMPFDEDLSAQSSANCEGIVVDVVKKSTCDDYHADLVVNILITKVDISSNFAGLQVNHRYPFSVTYSSMSRNERALGLYAFMVGGRRIRFSFLQVKTNGASDKLYNISNVSAI